MTELRQLLELMEKIKEKKPIFIRQDYQRRKKLGRKLRWKKPKGIHSKIRHRFKGHRKMPSPGHKSPIRVRGLHSTGLRMVNVSSLENLEKINRESEGIIISKGVGARKRLEILKKAKEMGVKILNLNSDEHIKKIESKKLKPKALVSPDVKESKKEEAKGKKDEDLKGKSQEKSEEKKKEAEKKEKDRILTKKT